MSRTRFLVGVTAALSIVGAGCGSDGVGEPSAITSPVSTVASAATSTTTTTDGPSTTEQQAVSTASTASTAPVTTSPPAVLGDPLDPASWIGHLYAEEAMADPFQHVVLDGTVTDVITVRYGAPSEPRPDGVPAFVRPDPGGAGFSGTEPGPWMVLAWRLSDPMNWAAGGIVTDAVLASSVTDDMPMSGCRSRDGEPGVFLGFVRYDPTYVPDGAETAPFPTTQAWRITDEGRLAPVPVDGVVCDWYEFGN